MMKKGMKRTLSSMTALTIVTGTVSLGGVAASAANDTLVADYYSVNKTGMGVQKTITVDGAVDDWDSSMLIAQGAANDDPRVYRPDAMYELPTDLYALYGAYDDEKLYLMWEMTNVQDVVAPDEEYPLTDGTLYEQMNLPMFIAVDTGKSDTIGKNGKTWDGGTLWNSGITFEKSFNRLIAVSTNGGSDAAIYAGSGDGLIRRPWEKELSRGSN